MPLSNSPECLSQEQIEFYDQNGYLLLENQIPNSYIERIRDEVARFQEEARSLQESNDRIDLEESHTPLDPRIRRVKLPHLISAVIRELLFSDHVLAPARDLLGPDIRLHTTKLNMKSANYGAPIEWHQDFAFYPHTNDDVLAIGVIIDDMVEENGPLMVFPGSHKGPIHEHHVDDIFAGAMSLEENGYNPDNAVKLLGSAGSISIHHGRIVHGSALNTSDQDRRLLFLEMMAADAFPVMGSMTKFNSIEEYNERMLCGTPTRQPRMANVPVRIPQPQPDLNRSIYEIQSSLNKRTFEPLS